MIALSAYPEQANGLRQNNRGQHARVRPRKAVFLKPSRPEGEGALQQSISLGSSANAACVLDCGGCDTAFSRAFAAPFQGFPKPVQSHLRPFQAFQRFFRKKRLFISPPTSHPPSSTRLAYSEICVLPAFARYCQPPSQGAAYER
jgi:hypothetical protein